MQAAADALVDISSISDFSLAKCDDALLSPRPPERPCDASSEERAPFSSSMTGTVGDSLELLEHLHEVTATALKLQVMTQRMCILGFLRLLHAVSVEDGTGVSSCGTEGLSC